MCIRKLYVISNPP